MSAEFSLSMRGKAMALKRQLARGAGTLYFTPTQMQQRSLQELQQWCDCYGVGQPLAPSGGWRFSRACLRALEECLAQLRVHALDEELAAERTDRIQQGSFEHKGYGHKPSEHRLLCSLPMPGKFSFPLQVSQSRCVADVDWRQLHLGQCQGIVVVENLDTFYLYGSEQCPELPSMHGFWVVYRGHDEKAKNVALLQSAVAARGLPQVFFGDFDAKGLSLALHEGYTHVLLPTIESLAQHATLWHAPAKQVGYFTGIEEKLTAFPANHALHAYVALLREQKGLLQQGMAALAMTCLNLRN